MVPATVVDQSIGDLVPFLEAGDTIIDGGNSYYGATRTRVGEFHGFLSSAAN
jgi:6-phosphogluconate dehydrogenase